MANIAKIKQWDIANGEGIGVSVYFSGCDKEPKCKGCFNSEIWDFNAGEPFTKDTYKQIFEMLKNPHVNHLAILGGEPLARENFGAVRALCVMVKNYFPDKKVWLWTHYRWEQMGEMLDLIHGLVDVLIDGEYIEEQRDLTLKWRGSSNQRVIDVAKSLEQEKIVLYKD